MTRQEKILVAIGAAIGFTGLALCIVGGEIESWWVFGTGVAFIGVYIVYGMIVIGISREARERE